jgi:hypothetical protein
MVPSSGILPRKGLFMTLASLVVPTYRQMLGALSGWLDKARSQLSADGEALLSAAACAGHVSARHADPFRLRQAYEGVFRLGDEAFAPIVATLLNEGRNAGEQPGSLPKRKTGSPKPRVSRWRRYGGARWRPDGRWRTACPME